VEQHECGLIGQAKVDNWQSPGCPPDTGEDACCPGAAPDLARTRSGVSAA
jgi:hypothetical protein